MTRFARAKGSKASNERTPNDATPWHLMKQQLVDNLSKKEPLEKTKSAKELLEDKRDTVSSNNIDNSWAEFPNSSENKNSSITEKVKKKSKKKSSKRNINEVEDNSITEVKTKKHKKSKNHSDEVSDNKKEENQADTNSNELDPTIDKLHKKRKKDKHKTSQITEDKNNVSDNVNESHDEKDTFSKRQKRNMKRKKNFNENVSNNPENNNDGNVQNNRNHGESENKGDNQETRRFSKNFANRSNNFNTPNNFGMKKFENQKKKRKPPKIRDDKEHARRKPDLGPSKMMINGVEVKIVKYDGFPVKKEDADRLRDLKQKMIMKGIPQKEIAAAMKLERRKAEKALARMRKFVCFHCRKTGHNLSDCPELGSEQAGTGICFKCGSTEHTHFECKVAKPTEFRYATCFICREQGHIAKQCPDNPKGVYPQGGACNVCGDVTHLKKDCPDLIKEKEENTITVNTIANDNLESLEENAKSIDEKQDKKTKKIVKF